MNMVPLGWNAGLGVKFSEKQGKSTVTLTGAQGPAGEALWWNTHHPTPPLPPPGIFGLHMPPPGSALQVV